MLSKSYRKRAGHHHSSFLANQTELRPDFRTAGLSGLSPHCWNTDCHPLSEQWNFFNNFILISLGRSPDTLVIQEVISPRSCHSGSSRGCWPGPSLSLPKPSPAGVLRTEQFCAFSNGFASVLHFCVFPMLFGFFYFIFLISGMVLHLLLLPFFSKCFSACWSFFLLLPHFPCWSHLFSKDYKCDDLRHHKKRKGRRKEIRGFMYLESWYETPIICQKGLPLL